MLRAWCYERVKHGRLQSVVVQRLITALVAKGRRQPFIASSEPRRSTIRSSAGIPRATAFVWCGHDDSKGLSDGRRRDRMGAR